MIGATSIHFNPHHPNYCAHVRRLQQLGTIKNVTFEVDLRTLIARPSSLDGPSDG